MIDFRLSLLSATGLAFCLSIVPAMSSQLPPIVVNDSSAGGASGKNTKEAIDEYESTSAGDNDTFQIVFDLSAGVIFDIDTTPNTINKKNALTIGNESDEELVTVRKVGSFTSASLLRSSADDSGPSPLIIRNVNIENFRHNLAAFANGGAISNNSGQVTINSGMFKDNFARSTLFDAYGGAIYCISVSGVTINEGGFSGNYVTGDRIAYGGAIYSSSFVTIDNGTFSGNYTTSSDLIAYGGAIYSNSGGVTVTGGVFSGNHSNSSSSSSLGGAIYSQSGVTLTNGSFSGNYVSAIANAQGGAVYSFNGGVSVSGGTFSDNYATSSATALGGAIFSLSNDVTATNTTFSRNFATSTNTIAAGGAIYSRSSVNLENVVLQDNYAKNAGGAVFIQTSPSFSLSLKYKTTTDQVINPVNSQLITNFDPVIHKGNNDFACGVFSSSSPSANAERVTFEKEGAATLSLNTNNSYWYGNTLVEEGKLLIGEKPANVDSVWGSPTTLDMKGSITVNSGATLGGFGQIYAVKATFQSGSTFEVGLGDNDASGALNAFDATEPLVLNGTVNLAINSDSLLKRGLRNYTIISSSGGTLSTEGFVLPPNSAERKFSIFTSDNDKTIKLQVLSGSLSSAPSLTPGTNSYNIAAAFDSAFENLNPNNEKAVKLINALADLSDNLLPSALNQAAGQNNVLLNLIVDLTSSSFIPLSHLNSIRLPQIVSLSILTPQQRQWRQQFEAKAMTFQQFKEQLSERRVSVKSIPELASTKSSAPLTMQQQVGSALLWVQGSGRYHTQGSRGEFLGFKAKMGGFNAGIDYPYTSLLLVGAAVGHNWLNYDIKDSRDHGKVKTVSGGVYASYNQDYSGFKADGAAFVSFHRFKGQRSLSITPITDTLYQVHRGIALTGQGRLAYSVDLPKDSFLEPYLQGNLSHLWEDGYREKGEYGIAAKKRRHLLLNWSAGAELSRIIANDEILWRPMIQLGFKQRKALGGNGELKAQVIGITDFFTIKGDRKAHNYLSIGGEIKALNVKEGLSISANYKGDFNGKDRIHEALLSLKFYL